VADSGINQGLNHLWQKPANSDPCRVNESHSTVCICERSKYVEVGTRTRWTSQWKWWRKELCRKQTSSTKPRLWCTLWYDCIFYYFKR